MNLRHIFLSTALATLSLAAPAQDKLIGSVAWPANEAGLYDIDLQSSKLSPRLLEQEMFKIQSGGAFGQAAVRRDNLYYITNFFTEGTTIRIYHAVYDLNTNKRVWIKRNGLVAATPLDMTYCEADGKTYGCFHHPVGLGEAWVFGTLNLETWQVTEIKTLTQKWLALAAAPDGTLYAINDDGLLLKVDKATGNTQLIAQTDAPVYYESSACISADGKRMYLSVTDMLGGTAVLTIDLANGATIGQSSFSNEEEVLGLVLAEPTPATTAPSPAIGFEVPTCPTNTATATFTMPSTTQGGTAIADGTRLTAIITIDGKEAYNGKHTAGAKVTKELDAKLTGYHTFTLRIANDNGEQSSAVSVRRWVGKDTPNAPQNVLFKRSGKTNTITWDAVTTTVNEGYIDPTAITYSVYRYPGGDLVGGSLTTPKFTEEMDEPTSLTTVYYEVEAVVGGSGARSQRGESNHMSFSFIVPPYLQEFNSPSVLDAYTIIDGNNDGETWEWYDYSGSVRVFGSKVMDLDDWLITPAVHLEAGKYYEFSIGLHGYKRAYTEFFEICCGRTNAASEMTVKLLPRTQLSADAFTKYTVGYLAPESGEYYFGLHAISPAGTMYIYADDISISAPMEPDMPAQVADLTLTRAPKSMIAVDVAFTLPTKTVGGADLGEITRCVVVRDGYTTVLDRTDVKPGERISFTDKPGSTNFRRYSVTVYNAAGASAPAEAMEYVGPYSPAQPTDFVVRRTANDGEVHMSWKAPTTDIYGNELDPSLVSYTIAAMVNGSPAYIREWYHDNELTYQAQAAGQPQAFVNFALYAQVDGGSSNKLESTPCPVGAPYPTPFVESYSGGDFQTIWSPEDIMGVTTWDAGTDDIFDDIKSQDGDNGFIYATSLKSGNVTTLSSGLITVSGDSPILEYHFYSYGPDDNTKTTVRLLIDGEPLTVASVTHNAEAAGWQTATVPLTDYIGKDVQLQFHVFFGKHTTVAYDNIRVMDDITDNLTLAEAVIPSSVQAGKPFTIQATVQNNGKTDVPGAEYATVLLRDNTEVQRRKGFGTLRMGKSVTVTFNESLSVLDEGEHIYKVCIEYDADDKPSDNSSPDTKVQCVVPNYPIPTSLQANRLDEAQLTLSWSAPEEPDVMPTVTEGFESYTPWAQENVGDWKMIDNDGLVSGSIGSLVLPGVGGTFFAYTVLNSNEQPKIQSYAGSQCMLSVFAKGGANDEWLISPALSGHAQTISLWGRSGTAIYPESFQIMTTVEHNSTDISEYTTLETVTSVPSKWTEYTFSLPEGTTNFAVRCISNDAYYFTVDDITYTSDEYSTTDLIGYNLYRDGVKVNNEPIESLSVIDPNDLATDTSYDLTAVYAKGESRPAHITVSLTPVESVSGVRREGVIYDLSGRQLRNAKRGVNIIDGKKIVK
ncbi:MAG: hypothetical protein HUK04_00020 [Bacteroidaceae bacterium]|nr:hypothetical protein [Bacteroidaceae bacterium]